MALKADSCDQLNFRRDRASRNDALDVHLARRSSTRLNIISRHLRAPGPVILLLLLLLVCYNIVP